MATSRRQGGGDYRRADGRLDALQRSTGGGRQGDRRRDRDSFSSTRRPTRELAESLVHRAEAAGFKAIVVTLDTSTLGWRPRDLNDANFPQLHGHALANYFTDPRFRALLAKPPEEDGAAAALQVLRIFGKPLTWADLPWLRSLTKLPLILKGICHPDDARRAIDGGVDGIYCSNHGGRQANGGAGGDRHAAGRRRGLGRDAGAVRLRRSLGNRHRQGAGARARGRSASGGPTPTASRSTASTASSTCCAACSPKPIF